MHELLAILCEALEQEEREASTTVRKALADGPFNESDAYVLFDALMAAPGIIVRHGPWG